MAPCTNQTMRNDAPRPCSVLGLGLLPALEYAGARLLAPGARVVPACVQVCAWWLLHMFVPVAGRPLLLRLC